MIKRPYQDIENISKKFIRGVPLEKEIQLEQDIVFQFDNNSKEDILCDRIIASLYISKDKFFNKNPTENDKIDNIKSDVSSALTDGGFLIDYIELDEANSNNHHWTFIYQLQY